MRAWLLLGVFLAGPGCTMTNRCASEADNITTLQTFLQMMDHCCVPQKPEVGQPWSAGPAAEIWNYCLSSLPSNRKEETIGFRVVLVQEVSYANRGGNEKRRRNWQMTACRQLAAKPLTQGVRSEVVSTMWQAPFSHSLHRF